ncbi:MAG: PASTA domain-containing protein [Clostridia bacterium]|nr:PASTA domain-containing protein [Clostridia bacterium]
MPYLELTKDNEKEEDKKKQVEVPNVEGMTVAEAAKVLKEVNLDYQIENEPEGLDKTTTIIKEQLPKKGISIYEGTKILLKI